MFCNKPKNVRSVPAKRNRKRKRKTSYPQCDKKARQTDQSNNSHSSLAIAMSSWAQSYTAAATWQLKHQVAYWKARAKALEYQNRVLHDTIRQNFFKNSEEPTSICESENSSEADEENGDDENGDDENGDDECEDEQEEDFEVSEEFIEFLRKNAKYKEDAKKEKERLRALREAENEAQEEEVENYEERQAKFKNLYGDGWEKIMCLETSVLCDFMNECDKEQPQYWPNIPFNFDGC